MISWILGKVAPKAVLYVALGLLATNGIQFVSCKLKLASMQRSLDAKVQEFVDLAVKESHAQRDLIVAAGARQTLQDKLTKQEQRNATLSEIADRRDKRREDWRQEAYKWKSKYNRERCDENDEICLQWGSADYRGDG